MTTAPGTLLAVRALLQPHLGLTAAALGITGDDAHRGGYHCGNDRIVSGDYSVVESPRDRNGLTGWACALDVGSFTVRLGGTTHDLRSFSSWLVGQCRAGATDCADIREIIYSPDGTTVRRWDRLGKRSTGDASHRFHTHVSFHRDAVKSGRELTPVFRRYLTHIGAIGAPAPAAAQSENRKAPTMIMLKMAKSDTVYLSAGPGQGRAELADYINEMKPLTSAGVPLVTVADEAGLTRLGGPLLPAQG